MNTVFYISVSFLCSFRKIAISGANTQYSQSKTIVMMVGSKHQKNRGVAGVNRTEFSSTNALEGIILSLLIQESPCYTLNPQAKLVILGKEGKHFSLILFQTMFYLPSNCLERSWIWDLKKYGEYISNTCMSYKLWISTHIELRWAYDPLFKKYSGPTELQSFTLTELKKYF